MNGWVQKSCFYCRLSSVIIQNNNRKFKSFFADFITGKMWVVIALHYSFTNKRPFMRKLIYLLAGLLLPSLASAQLRNLDFEQWDHPVLFEDPAYNNPTGWICSNRWYGTELAMFTDKMVKPVDSSGQHNNYAIRLFTFYNYMKDAAVQTASIDYRPVALKGFYKYEENFIITGGANYIDTAQVRVWLTKWNTSLSKRDTIGSGIFSAHDSVNTFKPFEVNIAYYSSVQPDSITILLDPSILGRYPELNIQNLAEGGRSVFTLDNLSLANGVTGINAPDGNNKWSVYPVPAKNSINFQSINGNAIIYDIAGKNVARYVLRNASEIDISDLSSGIYILQISNEHGVFNGKIIKE
jgi:hypothetical protein